MTDPRILDQNMMKHEYRKAMRKDYVRELEGSRVIICLRTCLSNLLSRIR